MKVVALGVWCLLEYVRSASNRQLKQMKKAGDFGVDFERTHVEALERGKRPACLRPCHLRKRPARAPTVLPTLLPTLP
jgi:hypothetical protein